MLIQLIQLIQNQKLSQDVLSTLALIILVVLFRWLGVRAFRKYKVKGEAKRRWIVQVKNLSWIILGLGMVIIWMTEIRNFALSIAALGVAIVLASKELIVCGLGGVYRLTNHLFDVGDRIEIDGQRGDVIDVNFFSTRLMEIGPEKKTHQYTGRAFVIPNSLYLTKMVVNESYAGEMVVHVFEVPISKSKNWIKAEALLLKIAQEQCLDFIEISKKAMKKLAEKEGFETPSVEPRITVSLPDPEKIVFLVRVPVPVVRKGRVEQAIIRKFLESYSA